MAELDPSPRTSTRGDGRDSKRSRWPWIIAAITGAACLLLAIAVLRDVVHFR